MALPTRILGKTGAAVSIVGLGTGAFGFGKVPHDYGVAMVRRAVELGITYMDTAHHYESELLVGEGVQGQRDKVFLATKTVKRNKAGAWSDIRLSLEQLRTDRIDLLHIHCVNTLGDLDAVTSAGGCLEAILEAQKEGLVRFVGITGHARPNILALALERYPFDAVMPALGVMDSLVTAPQIFLLPAARKAGCGVIAMKVLGNGALAAHEDLAIRHALGLGASVVSVGVQSIEQVEAAAAAVVNPAPLTPDEEATLLTLAREQVHGRDHEAYWFNDPEVTAYRAGWIGAKR
jgi:aryl-alcohol dehydrogenase-like predicted oxidoreductase